MALCKHGDRVDMGRLERRGEVGRIEVGADVPDVFRGMKVEMDVPVAQRGGLTIRHDYSLVPLRLVEPPAN